jgi:hypothetical protein
MNSGQVSANVNELKITEAAQAKPGRRVCPFDQARTEYVWVGSWPCKNGLRRVPVQRAVVNRVGLTVGEHFRFAPADQRTSQTGKVGPVRATSGLRLFDHLVSAAGETSADRVPVSWRS